MRPPAPDRAYRADWDAFTVWCAARQLTPLPAAATTVAGHLDDVAQDHKVPTIRRRLAAVRAAHLDAGAPSPTGAAPVRPAVARAASQPRGRSQGTLPPRAPQLPSIFHPP